MSGAGVAPWRELALCADDFGLSQAVDRGILRLAAAGRLTEVSCIVNTEDWPGRLPELAALGAVAAGRLRIGLHFNLTEGLPLSAELRRHWPRLPSLPRLLLLSHLRAVPGAALGAELRAQWARFEAAAGRPPAHLDGHQHVHHLPVVRDRVLAELAHHPHVVVRSTARVGGPGFWLKRQLIAGTGGRALGRALQARGRAANRVLLGVYDFVDADYRGLMQQWLAAAPQHGALVMCHPGEALPAGQASDAIAAARARELSYLASTDFADDLAASGSRLAFSAQSSSGG